MCSHNMCDNATELMASDGHASDQCEFANDICSSAEQHACALEVCDHALTPLASDDDHCAPSIKFAERHPCTHEVHYDANTSLAIAADASILDSAPVQHDCITIANICVGAACSGISVNDAATSSIRVSGTPDQRDVCIALKHACASVVIQPDIIVVGNTVDALSESGHHLTSDCTYADAQVEPCKVADALICMSNVECFSEVCNVAYKDESVDNAAISSTSIFGTDDVYCVFIQPDIIAAGNIRLAFDGGVTA